MDVVREDRKLTGVREEDADDRGRWRRMISLWQPPKGKAKRRFNNMQTLYLFKSPLAAITPSCHPPKALPIWTCELSVVLFSSLTTSLHYMHSSGQ